MPDTVKNIVFPEHYTFNSMNRISSDLIEAIGYDRVFIDFGTSSSISPTAMLYLYKSLKNLILNREHRHLEFKNIECNQYAAHLGFFTLAGIPYGRQSDDGPTTENYIPVQEVSTASWLEDMRYQGLSSHVDSKCHELASILCKGMPGNELCFLQYNLREIVRNVFEHSRSQSVSFVAQCWPRLRRAEIAILDNGVGLRATTSRNDTREILTDLQAIDAALMPGFSGSDRLIAGDEWDNSGFGLYMTSEMARQLGSFTISSGSNCKRLSKSKTQEMSSNTPGTFVAMEFSWEQKFDFSNYMKGIADTGEESTRIHFAGKLKRASKSSKGDYNR